MYLHLTIVCINAEISKNKTTFFNNYMFDDPLRFSVKSRHLYSLIVAYSGEWELYPPPKLKKNYDEHKSCVL